MAVIKWEEYELASNVWHKYWHRLDAMPCTFHEFLEIPNHGITFGKRLNLAVLPDDAGNKIHHLCSPHFETAIKVWMIRNESKWSK